MISACLLGIKCNYAGSSWALPQLLEEFKRGELFPACPEVLGGLPIPRPPAEIQRGAGPDVLDGRATVVSEDGRDVTAAFIKGAQAVAAIAETIGAREALLTERSPSCGCGIIFDGTFSSRFRRGDGVTAALLKRRGVAVRSMVVDSSLPGPGAG